MSETDSTQAQAQDVPVFYWITIQWDNGMRSATYAGGVTVPGGTDRQEMFTFAINAAKENLKIPGGDAVVVLAYGESPRYF